MAIHEECGVFGIYDKNGGCAESAYYGLYALQHRGQEACGIATVADLNMRCRKDVGLVGDVFSREDLEKLGGAIWRWATCATPPPAAPCGRTPSP